LAYRSIWKYPCVSSHPHHSKRSLFLYSYTAIEQVFRWDRKKERHTHSLYVALYVLHLQRVKSKNTSLPPCSSGRPSVSKIFRTQSITTTTMIIRIIIMSLRSYTKGHGSKTH
jgi:hypothetical protein